MKTGSDNLKSHLTDFRVPSVTFLSGLMLLITCCTFLGIRSAAGNAANTMRYRAGIRNSPSEHKLKSKQLETVLKSLRDKTGFLDLGFDENGFLRIGDKTQFIGGSATARALLASALTLPHSIDLESHNFSSEIAFARLAKSVVYQSKMTGETINVYPIELDFSDFIKLRGNRKVLEAFDVGFVILHELGHAVLGLRDSVDTYDSPGECEEYVNLIRRELNLPERKNYIARTYKSSASISNNSVEYAELTFIHPGENALGSKPKKLYLSWDAHLVGPVKQTSSSLTTNTRSARTIATEVNGQ